MSREERARTLPLFPLDAVLLFPGTRVPLHVFEPRYRRLAADALAGDRRIGLVTVRPEHHHAMAGCPPLYGVGCEGFVLRWRRLADGRFDLWLRGTERFRLVRELPPEGPRLYRCAEVEPLPEAEPGPAARSRAARERVFELIDALANRGGGHARSPGPGLAERLDGLADATFANTLAQSLVLSTAERQGLLEASGPAERLEILEGVLRFQLATLEHRGAGDSHTLH